jgi:hypothetical protein
VGHEPPPYPCPHFRAGTRGNTWQQLGRSVHRCLNLPSEKSAMAGAGGDGNVRQDGRTRRKGKRKGDSEGDGWREWGRTGLDHVGDAGLHGGGARARDRDSEVVLGLCTSA